MNLLLCIFAKEKISNQINSQVNYVTLTLAIAIEFVFQFMHFLRLLTSQKQLKQNDAELIRINFSLCAVHMFYILSSVH